MACSNPRKIWGAPQKIIPQGCGQPCGTSDLPSFAQDGTSVYPKDTTYSCQASDATDWTPQKLKEPSCASEWTSQRMESRVPQPLEGANTFTIAPAGSYGTFSSIINLTNVKEERCISRGVFDLKIKPQTVFLVYYSFEQRSNNNPHQSGTSQNEGGSGAEDNQNRGQPQVGSSQPLRSRMSSPSAGRQYPSQYVYNTERSSNNPSGSYTLKYNNPPAGFSLRSPLTNPRPFSPPFSKIPKAKPDDDSAEMSASQYDIEKLNAYVRSRSPVNRSSPQPTRNESSSRPHLPTWVNSAPDQGNNQTYQPIPYAKRSVGYPKRRICPLPEDPPDQHPDDSGYSGQDQLRAYDSKTRNPEAYARPPIGYADIHTEQNKTPLRPPSYPQYLRNPSPSSEEGLELSSFNYRVLNRSDSSQMYDSYNSNSVGESYRTQTSPSLIKREETAKDMYSGIPLTRTAQNIYQVQVPKFTDDLPPGYPPARQRALQKPDLPGEDSWYSPPQSQEGFNTFNVERAQSPSQNIAPRSPTSPQRFSYRSPPAQEQQTESSSVQADNPASKHFREFQRKILDYSPVKKVSAINNFSGLNSRYSTEPDNSPLFSRDDNSSFRRPSSPDRYQHEVGFPRRTSHEVPNHQLSYDQKEDPRVSSRSPPRDPYNPPIPQQKSQQSHYQDQIERYKHLAPSTSTGTSESPRSYQALTQRNENPKAVRAVSVGPGNNDRKFHQEYDSNSEYVSNSEYAETSRGYSQAPSSTVPIYSVTKSKYPETATAQLDPENTSYFNAYTMQRNQQIPPYIERYLRHQECKYGNARDENPPPYELYDMHRFTPLRQPSNTALIEYDRRHAQVASSSFHPSVRSNDYEPNDYPMYRPPTDYYRPPIGYPLPRPYLPYDPYRPDGYYARNINRYPCYPYRHPYELEYVPSSPPFIPYPPNFRTELDYLDLVTSRSMSRWYDPPVIPPTHYNYPPRVYPEYDRLPRQLSLSCTSINARFPMTPEYMQNFYAMGMQDIINNPFSPNMQEVEQRNIEEQRQNVQDEKQKGHHDRTPDGLLNPDQSGDVHANLSRQKHPSSDDAKNNAMVKSQRKKDTGDSASLDSQSLRYQATKSVPSKGVNPAHIKTPTAVKPRDSTNN